MGDRQMHDTVAALENEIERLHRRLRTVNREKANLQMAVDLITQISEVTGVSDTLSQILQILITAVGGSNIAVYYETEGRWRYADVLGERRWLDTIDDEAVQQAIQTKAFFKLTETGESKMALAGMPRSYETWVYPLKVHETLFGVVRLEGMAIEHAHYRDNIDPFIKYAAILLYHEVSNLNKIQAAYHEASSAKQELQKSKEQYELALTSANNGLFDWNLETGEIYYSPVWKSLLGYKDHEIQNKLSEWERLTNQEDVKATWAALEEVLAGRRDHFEKEFRMQHKDGHWVNILSRARVIFDPAGKGRRFVGTHVDISRVKRMEKELRDSEIKFSKAFHHAPLMMAISDYHTGEFIDINQAHLDVSGYTREDLIGKKSADVHWIEPECRERLALELKTKGFVRDREIIIYAKSGESIHCSYSGVLLQVDGQLRIVSISLNITQRKNMEKHLIEQKLLFETMFNTIPDGVVITNNEREILLANKGMKTTFGYSPGELQGRKTQVLYADSQRYEDTGKNVFGKEAQHPGNLYTTRYKTKEGRTFTGETFGAKLYDENKTWIGNLGIMRDITEREEAELRIRQAQKMESIGNLAGGIAHDFNNILFPIIGMSELLLEDFAPGSPEHRNVKEILTAGMRGRDLVSQILAFSRQSGRELIPLKIQHILKEVLKLSRATIPTNIEIIQNIQKDCDLVMANATQIHQIAMNLMTNAYHAITGSTGKIIVELTETDGSWAETPSVKAQRYARLSVSDTGTGMPPGIVKKIFDPYFTTKKKGKGTGLGLAVVYGIVQEYKGEIRVISEPGKGTTFTVYLPLMAKKPIPGKQPRPRALPRGNERILLVDDEEAVLGLEKQMLERLGYQVSEQPGSVAALDAFKGNPDRFDLVITDMTMPSMTGDELALRILSIRPDMPVVICTGFSEKLNADLIERIGIRGLLTKPVTSYELARMVRQALDGSPVEKGR